METDSELASGPLAFGVFLPISVCVCVCVFVCVCASMLLLHLAALPLRLFSSRVPATHTSHTSAAVPCNYPLLFALKRREILRSALLPMIYSALFGRNCNAHRRTQKTDQLLIFKKNGPASSRSVRRLGTDTSEKKPNKKPRKRKSTNKKQRAENTHTKKTATRTTA